MRSTRALVWTITAFTLAHSITLALATLGVVHVPGPPVEAAIAFSILLLASEIVRMRQGESSVTGRWPWVVAFCFGLLHGFGFAGALSEIGLPRGDIPLALFAFNVGVELGQLAFIGAMLGTLSIARRLGILTFVERHVSAGRALRDRRTGRVLVRRACRRVLGLKHQGVPLDTADDHRSGLRCGIGIGPGIFAGLPGTPALCFGHPAVTAARRTSIVPVVSL